MYPVWGVKQSFLDLQYVRMQHARCLRRGIFLRKKECLGRGAGRNWDKVYFPPLSDFGCTAGLARFLATVVHFVE